MRKNIIFLLLLGYTGIASAQSFCENVVVVTLDGFRWQEVFYGADSLILFNSEFVKDSAVAKVFWDNDAEQRRAKLLPFFWNVIAREGQLYGNRNYNNKVNCANPYWFSYPGYSELLTGQVDRKMRSNNKVINPNPSVFEFIHQQPAFQGKVAAFSTWNVIPYILRTSRNGIYVNSGRQRAEDEDISDVEKEMNRLQDTWRNAYGERYDTLTFQYAWEYMKRKSPRVVFISLDETDEHAHGGRYGHYLRSAHQADAMIGALWNWLQSQDAYRDKTTLLITTDHGRGRSAKNSWKHHGRLQFGSSEMWFAVIGPQTPAAGEMRIATQYYQKQIAQTIAAFLGLEFTHTGTVAPFIETMIGQSMTRR
jgi:hypothetical protein